MVHNRDTLVLGFRLASRWWRWLCSSWSKIKGRVCQHGHSTLWSTGCFRCTRHNWRSFTFKMTLTWVRRNPKLLRIRKIVKVRVLYLHLAVQLQKNHKKRTNLNFRVKVNRIKLRAWRMKMRVSRVQSLIKASWKTIQHFWFNRIQELPHIWPLSDLQASEANQVSMIHWRVRRFPSQFWNCRQPNNFNSEKRLESGEPRR